MTLEGALRVVLLVGLAAAALWMTRPRSVRSWRLWRD